MLTTGYTSRDVENAPKAMNDDDEGPDRRTMLRDIAMTQVKLVVDGLRDFLLVPASLVVGIISLLSVDAEKRAWFYQLIRVGKRSEHWINLFGAFDNAPPSVKRDVESNDRGIDDLVDKVEDFVVEEYRSGGVTRQAKDRLDRVLKDLQRNNNAGDEQ